jgi:hypothetical protein
MMMTMIDNDDVFLNLNNYPNPIAAFNSIMRQYYDTEGNPIRRRQTNENREIVSSVQSTNTRTGTSEKKDALTLDLLLTKRPYRITLKEEMTRAREVAGKEILTSTTPLTDSNKNFDIRDFMKHYSREQQTSDRNIHSTTSSNKLTLADLQSARQQQTRTFIKSKSDDY